MKASYNCGYKWVRFLKWLAASFVLKFVIFVHHLLCLLPYICLPMPCSLNHHPVWYCLLSCQAVGHCSIPSLPSVCCISTVLFCLRVSIVHKLWTGIVVFQCWGWFPSWATLSCLSWLPPFTWRLNILKLFCCEVFSILARESWECQKRSEKTVAIALKTAKKCPKRCGRPWGPLPCGAPKGRTSKGSSRLLWPGTCLPEVLVVNFVDHLQSFHFLRHHGSQHNIGNSLHTASGCFRLDKNGDLPQIAASTLRI